MFFRLETARGRARPRPTAGRSRSRQRRTTRTDGGLATLTAMRPPIAPSRSPGAISSCCGTRQRGPEPPQTRVVSQIRAGEETLQSTGCRCPASPYQLLAGTVIAGWSRDGARLRSAEASSSRGYGARHTTPTSGRHPARCRRGSRLVSRGRRQRRVAFGHRERALVVWQTADTARWARQLQSVDSCPPPTPAAAPALRRPGSDLHTLAKLTEEGRCPQQCSVRQRTGLRQRQQSCASG